MRKNKSDSFELSIHLSSKDVRHLKQFLIDTQSSHSISTKIVSEEKITEEIWVILNLFEYESLEKKLLMHYKNMELFPTSHRLTMYLKPEIGKLYKMIHYEMADEFHRYVGPDDFGQEIFCSYYNW